MALENSNNLNDDESEVEDSEPIITCVERLEIEKLSDLANTRCSLEG